MSRCVVGSWVSGEWVGRFVGELGASVGQLVHLSVSPFISVLRTPNVLMTITFAGVGEVFLHIAKSLIFLG